MTELPVILHIPHSSLDIPQHERDEYIVSGAELDLENLRLVDMHTHEIYDLPGSLPIIFPVSRFLVDAERFSDDAQESMAARGMGALYTVTTQLTPLRHEISSARREELMQRYYWPHHHALDRETGKMLDRFGKCLFIDCHSYPSKALPYELQNRELPRPQIGIGTDPFHTPKELASLVAGGFEELGYEVGLDVPFSGTLVPSAYYGRDARVMSFMIEIRKDLYMDEATGAKTAGFAKVQADVTEIMGRAARFLTGQSG